MMNTMSYRKRMVALILTIMSTTFLLAQGYAISGYVVDNATQDPLSGVTVKLNDVDSVMLTGVVTGVNGKFKIGGIKKGNYTIVVSCVGYESSAFSIANLSGNYDLGKIQLSESSTELGEAVVTANNNRYDIDRQIIIVTDALRKKSQDAFDLLYHSSLPDIRYNIADKTLSSLKNGTLQLRIDNVVHDVSDLPTIMPQDVTSIEYIDQPGIRYGDGVVAVINIKTNHKNIGYQVGVNTSNGVTKIQGRDNFVVRRVTNHDIIRLTGGINYTKTSSEYADSWTDMYFPDGLKSIVRTGTPQANKNQYMNAKLEYTRFIGSNLTINAFVSYNFINTPKNMLAYSTVENGASLYSEKTVTNGKSHNIAADFYLDWKMKADQDLLFNLTATYISSRYSRDYDSGISQPLAYNTEGSKKSMIAELIYEKRFNGQTFSAGARGFIANTDNSYSGSTGNISPFMKNRDIYAFTELKGNLSKLGYSLGAGLSSENFKEYGIDKTYVFFRPSVTLSYPFTTNLKLTYSLRINPMKPTLSDMTEISQPINSYEVVEGNPNIKPYQAYMNTLTLGYYTNATSISLSGYFQYNDSPIMGNPIYYSNSDNAFLRTMSNQKSFMHGQIRLYASQSLFNDKLNLWGMGVVNRYINNGNDLTTTMTAFMYGAGASYSEDVWGVTADFTSNIKMNFANVIIYTAPEIQLYAYYKYRSCTFGLGVLNPFIGNNPTSKRTMNYTQYQSHVESYNGNRSNRIFVTFEWNFQIGKKKSYNKKLSNEDYDAGIVK